MAHILPDTRMATPAPCCPHGTSYAQPCYSCGWTCPACKRSYAPWVRECSYSHEVKVEDASLWPLNVTPIPPQPVIRVPPEMASPHCTFRARVGGEWTEVLEGLQVRWNGSWGNEPAACIEFRLTPEGGTDEPCIA